MNKSCTHKNLRGHPQRGSSFTSLSPMLKCTTHPLTCAHIHCLVSINYSITVDECQGVVFFLHGGNPRHTCASDALPCQTPFCQTAPLLPSVTQQQHEIEYCCDGSTSTAIPPTSSSAIMAQHNEIGSIAFGAVLIQNRI